MVDENPLRIHCSCRKLLDTSNNVWLTQSNTRYVRETYADILITCKNVPKDVEGAVKFHRLIFYQMTRQVIVLFQLLLRLLILFCFAVAFHIVVKCGYFLQATNSWPLLAQLEYGVVRGSRDLL